MILVGVVAGLHAAAGALDTTFGSTGVVITDFGSVDVAYALATAPGGRLIAAGASMGPSGNDMGVARYLSDGRLDVAFGTGGTVRIDAGSPDDRAYAVDVSPSGRIVIGGHTYSATTGFDFVLAALTPAGSLDASFGSDGIVVTNFGSGEEGVSQVKLLPGGKILVAGHRVNDNSGEREFILARYNQDGSLDTSFADNGWLESDLPLSRIAVRPNGDIVAVGDLVGLDGYRLLLARFTRAGQPDETFGVAGHVTHPVPYGYARFGTIALSADGRIVVGGDVAAGENEIDVAIARFTRSGQFDPTFGTEGIATARISWSVYMAVRDVAIQPDGRVVAAGFTYGAPFAPHTPSFAVARFDRRGRIDATFGSGGFAVTTIGSRAEANALALLPGGDIVVAGFAEQVGLFWWDFALARYRGK